MNGTHGTLVLAWGNPGRRDDGLGPALADALLERELPGVTVSTGYQLQVEDAADLAAYRRVIFADADRTGGEPFRLAPLEPTTTGVGFSSHSLTPGALLSLARDLFQARPEAWLMGIRGYDFDEFGEGLSARARSNLEQAVDFVCDAVQSDDLNPVTAPQAEPARREEGDA